MPIMPLIAKPNPLLACLSRFNGSCPHADDPAAPPVVTAEGEDVTNDRGTAGTLLRAKCAPRCSASTRDKDKAVERARKGAPTAHGS